MLFTIPEAGVATAISVWQDDAKRAPGAALQDSEISGTTVERLLRVMADRKRTADAAAEFVSPGKVLGREYVPPDAVFVWVVSSGRTSSRPELAAAPITQVLQPAAAT